MKTVIVTYVFMGNKVTKWFTHPVGRLSSPECPYGHTVSIWSHSDLMSQYIFQLSLTRVGGVVEDQVEPSRPSP